MLNGKWPIVTLEELQRSGRKICYSPSGCVLQKLNGLFGIVVRGKPLFCLKFSRNHPSDTVNMWKQSFRLDGAKNERLGHLAKCCFAHNTLHIILFHRIPTKKKVAAALCFCDACFSSKGLVWKYVELTTWPPVCGCKRHFCTDRFFHKITLNIQPEL